MAWIDKRKSANGSIQYRVRDKIDGKIMTVIKHAGLTKSIAEMSKVQYLNKKAVGVAPALETRSLPVGEVLEIYAKHHGPSLQDGLNGPAHRKLIGRLNAICAAWADKSFETITKHDVRDFLARFQTVGTVMKYLGTLTHMFRAIDEWNEEGILGQKIKTPPFNPASKWRKEMKSSQKKEVPRSRVLTPEEWNRFKVHLSPRARAICEIALRRFLRQGDIQKISQLNFHGDIIKGVQGKTGEHFIIPALANQPTKYDFTNFRKEFEYALIASAMNYPPEHPLAFTFRDLRRTGATWAYKKTRDLVSISKMLGHTKITTTIRYLHIDDADRAAVARAVDELAEDRA